MIKYFILSILLVGVSLFGSELTEISEYSIHDGDTLTVVDSNKNKFKIRLYGIDAPELSQSYGKESAYHLKKLLIGRLFIQNIGIDKYDRSVSILYCVMNYGGETIIECVNHRMILDGYAWYYRYTKPVSNSYKFYEDIAKSNKLGLWKDPNPVEPYKFRKE